MNTGPSPMSLHRCSSHERPFTRTGSPDWNGLLRELADSGRKRKRGATAEGGEVLAADGEVQVEFNADGSLPSTRATGGSGLLMIRPDGG